MAAYAETNEEHSYGRIIVAIPTLSLVFAFGMNFTVSVLLQPHEVEFG